MFLDQDWNKDLLYGLGIQCCISTPYEANNTNIISVDFIVYFSNPEMCYLLCNLLHIM